MTGKLAALMLAFALPAAEASPFEKHFGRYEVFSASDKKGCPAQWAWIGRKPILGHRGIVFEAWAESDPGYEVSCSFRFTIGLSVQEMPGVTCSETEDSIHCTSGSNDFSVIMNKSASGFVNMEVASGGESASRTTWILRKK